MRYLTFLMFALLAGCTAQKSESAAASSPQAAFVAASPPVTRAPRKTVCPKAPSSSELAMLVARSSSIVRGEINGKPAQILAVKHDYLTLPVHDMAWAKGSPPPLPLAVRVYLDETYKPSGQTIAGTVGKSYLLFLTRKDAEGEQRFYFSLNDDSALQVATPANIAAVQAEVGRQGRLLADWAPDDTLPYYTQVRELIQQLAAISPQDEDKKEKQSAIFVALEKLGASAVPAIVAQMDDRRELADHNIALDNNFPGAFEARRLYGPDEIVDALSAILNQLTSVGFTTIYNGGTDAERDADVAGWRIYASDLLCEK